LSNLFKDLSRHLSERHEDFLTNSFVYLLNYLLDNEKPLGIALLNFICVKNSEFVFSEGEEVVITTQKSTSEGTPDIEIKSIDKCIYVEVKHDSGLGIKQIERYRKALGNERMPVKKIVLLTKFSLDFEESKEEGAPDKHIRWYQIHRYLEELKPRGEVGKFLINQFIGFLEGKQMAIQRVGWEYTNGIRAFLNLVNMIGIAIEDLGIKIYQKTAGWEWRGYYLEGRDEFCGVYFEEPDSIYLFSFGLLSYKPQEKDFRFPFYEDDGGTYFELALEDAHFFALQKDEQLDFLKKFISTCHSEAKRLKK
jgi:hypothetical protein